MDGHCVVAPQLCQVRADDVWPYVLRPCPHQVSDTWKELMTMTRPRKVSRATKSVASKAVQIELRNLVDS